VKRKDQKFGESHLSIFSHGRDVGATDNDNDDNAACIEVAKEPKL